MLFQLYACQGMQEGTVVPRAARAGVAARGRGGGSTPGWRGTSGYAGAALRAGVAAAQIKRLRKPDLPASRQAGRPTAGGLGVHARAAGAEVSPGGFSDTVSLPQYLSEIGCGRTFHTFRFWPHTQNGTNWSSYSLVSVKSTVWGLTVNPAPIERHMGVAFLGGAGLGG
jgi:hypothetical protein